MKEAVQLFNDGITLYYTRLRAYLEGTERAITPRITQVPEVLKQRIAHLREVTRHIVGPYIVPDQSAGLTGFCFEQKTDIDFQGKSVAID